MKRGMTIKHVLIGGAWPYANGSLHIGNIVALLPGDVLASFCEHCQKVLTDGMVFMKD